MPRPSRFPPLALLLAAAVTALPARAAHAKGAIKLKKLTCAYVVDSLVLPLAGEGNRYERGKLRCTASLVVSPRAENPATELTMTLRQDDRSASGKTAASLWPGFKHAVEVEVPLDGGEFTCGNIEITVSLADGDARTAKAKADCPD